MATIPFWKLQSVGNDFPLVHLADVASADADAFTVTARLAALSLSINDRHFGVGGDGLLAIGMEGDALRLRMFNPDGTEDFCGNGIRCAVVHARAEGWVPDQFVVKHLDRDVPVEIRDGLVRTTLGVADYHPERVPHTAYGELFNTTVWSGMDSGQPLSLFGSSLTTGSTHTIIPTSCLPDDDSFRSVSAKIEVDARFPQRTSVIWSQEIAPDHLKIRIWERGVGETLGCGTGASAAAADYLRRRGRGGEVLVESPGGSLAVAAETWNAPLVLIGKAQSVFLGRYELLESIK